jgi:hypothetical protein
MGRFLKGQEAIEHLKAGGTLLAENGLGYFSFERDMFMFVDKTGEKWKATFSIPHFPEGREVRTEPPAQQCVAPADLTNALHDRIHPASGRLLSASPIKPRAYAVGDIVTGDAAYRLVGLGARVVRPQAYGDLCSIGIVGGVWDYVDPERLSHARRTLWNPDADEWRIVEPPKTITADEARQVVAAGGAVARTFVTPESEWVEHTFRWYERIVDGDGEWVVRRAAVEPAPQPSVLTTEESWALRRTEEGQVLNKHEQGLLAKTLRRLETELVVTQARLAGVSQERAELRASAGKTPSLTAEELNELERFERGDGQCSWHTAGILAKALRRLAGD